MPQLTTHCSCQLDPASPCAIAPVGLPQVAPECWMLCKHKKTSTDFGVHHSRTFGTIIPKNELGTVDFYVLKTSGMEFFTNKFNGNFLINVLPNEDTIVDSVVAAIAYGSDSSTLIKYCREKQLRLDIWMRYDHTVPVSPKLLRELLAATSSNIFCTLIPDVLHSKIIWWKGYGVYIGSANLTDRAWNTNIEFGVFLSEVELEGSDGLTEIEQFFDELENCPAARPLTQEIIDEQCKLYELRTSQLQKLDQESERNRSIEKWGGPAHIPSRKAAIETAEYGFVKEWENGLTFLRQLAADAPDFRPSWLNKSVPPTWQADQFLHAFYYNQVVESARHPFEEFYSKNRNDPARAVKDAMRWWSKLPEPPSDEDMNCHERAPVIRDVLKIGAMSLVSLEEFAQVCKANHSTMDHVRRLPLEFLGIGESEGTGEDERGLAFAEWLWGKRNARGETVIELLEYVFDGGPPGKLPMRIFEASKLKDRRLPHFGTNQIAELAGWARPELCPPRNGRTSKSLRALGFDVKVH